MDPLSNSQLAYGEMAVEKLAQALEITDKESAKIIIDGLANLVFNKDASETDNVKINYLINELAATFDLY